MGAVNTAPIFYLGKTHLLQEEIALNNFRMWAYALIAIGLLNWDYQRAQPHVVFYSLLIITPGIILLLLTLISAGRRQLAKSYSARLWAGIGLAAIIIAFLNH